MNYGISYGAGRSWKFWANGGRGELTKGDEERCKRCEKSSGKEQVMNGEGAYVSGLTNQNTVEKKVLSGYRVPIIVWCGKKGGLRE